ncbi:hypothetical protein F3Y22_tig00110888pilonHSYRG00050 [Hibiscus syriacus]|uniref:Uncharacterized protein n=1 Tax=Hibiscus syriacus TaxID=106335 RepID=A0A6A2ZL13_HIBSY|nr:hypothetical protein F3Y22_tig00110888pilonHSYRG00050 [Hibiscus syriacus]
MHLGLPMDGDVISGMAHGFWIALCREYLGRVLESFNDGQILLNWLDANFRELSEDASDDEVKIYARPCILQLIGGLLMPDKSCNQVHCVAPTPRYSPTWRKERPRGRDLHMCIHVIIRRTSGAPYPTLRQINVKRTVMGAPYYKGFEEPRYVPILGHTKGFIPESFEGETIDWISRSSVKGPRVIVTDIPHGFHGILRGCFGAEGVHAQ